MQTRLLTVRNNDTVAVFRGGGLLGIPTEPVCGPDAGESERTIRYIREKMGEYTGVICIDKYISRVPGCAAEMFVQRPWYKGEAEI